MAQLFYTNYFTPNVLQSLLACDFLQKPIKHQLINKKFDPITLVTEHGNLNQPNAILRYLTSGTALNGTQSNDQNHLQQWFQYFNLDLYPVLRQLEAQVFGHNDACEQKFNYCLKELTRILEVFNNYLKCKTFFVGNTISSFDICLACHLDTAFRVIIDEDWRKKIIHLIRWFSFVRTTGPFLKRYGKMNLCGKKAFLIKQEVVEKQKPVAKKEAEQTQAIEQNSANSFKLDNFKREFQNSQNKIEVVKKLLDEFEKYNEQWSIWKIHYEKDSTEGKKDYLTMNMASGSLQRLEALRKTGFGSWGVYGQQGNYQIRGVMLWKGTQIAQEWKDHPSYAYHKFFKLDHKSVEDQQLIIDYWLGSHQAEGLPLHESKKLI